jgi:predicted DNA-binding protein
MAGILQSIPAWRYDSGKADKEHVEEQLSENENPSEKEWDSEALKPLLNLDTSLDSIKNELAYKREKVEIKLESVEDDSVAHEVPEKMKDIEEKISGIGDEEKEEILMLLRGRY